MVPYLRSYLDHTADIQTVSLLASLIPPRSLSANQRAIVDRWTESYRDILDSWKMFAQRVEFDVRRQEIARDLGAIVVSPSKGNCPVCVFLASWAAGRRDQKLTGQVQSCSVQARTGSCTAESRAQGDYDLAE